MPVRLLCVYVYVCVHSAATHEEVPGSAEGPDFQWRTSMLCSKGRRTSSVTAHAKAQV